MVHPAIRMSRVLPSPLIRALLAALLAVAGGMPTPLSAQEIAMEKHLEITGSERLRIIYDSTFTWPGGEDETAVMDLPIPPDTGAQRIDSFTSSLKGRSETDDQGHRLLITAIRHDGGDERRSHWRVEITGVFQTRQLVDGPRSSTAPPIVAPAPGEFLASTDSINWRDDSFQGWLDSSGLRRAGDETPVDYGARVYAYLRAHGRYTYPPTTAWNAAACSRRLRTDCGGFSLVFTAACRAGHIPARLLVGQCFKARERGDGTVALTGGRQAHVIAEFFDPRIGWIPEDISSTLLRTRGYSDLNFFGRDPGFFFAWHVDTDFHFDTPRKADAHVQWIQNPNLWFSENADDANDTVSHHWNVERL